MGEPQGQDLPTITPPCAPGALSIRAPRGAADWTVARRLVRHYAATPEVAACVQEIAAEIEGLDRLYGPPAGSFRIAVLGEEAVGCFGLKALGAADIELKRLFVSEAARGRGVGQALLAQAIGLARAGGYARLLLDTLPSMRTAQALYARAGFRTVPPYLAKPTPGAICYALELRGP